MDERDTAHRVIQFLKENRSPFTPSLIWEAVEQLGIEGTPELVQNVLAEGAGEATRAIERFLDALDILRPGLSRVEAYLRNGYEAEVSPSLRKGKWGVDLSVKDPHKERVESWRYTSPAASSLGGLELHARAGLVTLGDNYSLEIVGDGVFFKTEKGEHLAYIAKALSKVKPFLSALGHEGLPEALEALGDLEEGESRLEGRYILAHGEGFWALRDWPIMGDPRLDGAILLERDVSLDFPGDVGVSFRVLWHERSKISALSYVRFRLGEESLHVRSPRNWTDVSGKDVITSLVRGAIEEEFKDAERRGWRYPEPPSARMLAFLRAFVEHEAPFQALANGGFFPYVTAELFRDL